MFKKAEVRIEDGFAFGKTGWMVIVVISDTFGGVVKVGGLHYNDRKEAVRTYTLISSLIGAIQ